MVNREATPLIVGLLIPLLFLGVIVLRMKGFDILLILGKINIMYYIVLFPIVLGLIAALFNRKKG